MSFLPEQYHRLSFFIRKENSRPERDPYMDSALTAFPYVNGGLFKGDIVIPQFTEETRFILLQEASAEFDWKDISPVHVTRLPASGADSIISLQQRR